MLNKKRKGFTIVELVIVIAVIAVLAAVLIPTFSGVVDKANESAALQEVQNAYKEALALALSDDGVIEDRDQETANDFIFVFSNNGADATVTAPQGFGFSPVAISGGKVVLGPANGGNGGGNGGGNAGGETPTGTALTADNLDALASGGEFYLSGDLTISQAIEISADTTINLNGHELYINDPSPDDDAYNPITVEGTLKIEDNSTENIENAGTIIISQANHSYANNFCCGISVNGALNLDGVNIKGYRSWNINNYGTTNLNNVKYTVNCGYGLATKGADTTDAVTGETVASVTISNSTFIAAGTVNPIYCPGGSGSMKISETEFSKADNSVTYLGSVIDWRSNGDLTLEDVTVKSEASEANVSSNAKLTVNGGSFGGSLTGKPLVIEADENDTFAGEITLAGRGNSISGGTFSGKLTFGYGSETEITGGTFTGGLKCGGSNGVYAKVVIKDGKFSNTLEFIDWSDVEIYGGKFNSVLTLMRTDQAVINIYIKNGTTFGETTLSETTGDSAVYTVPEPFSNYSVTKGTDGWTIKP